MMKDNDFLLRQVEPAQPLSFDKDKCTNCRRCIDACPGDILIEGENSGDIPIVAYPDECWYCGCCVLECPAQAIRLRHPLMNQVRWIEKKDLLENKEK